MSKIKWDDVEFSISKGAYGVDVHVGSTPQYATLSFLERLTITDYALYGGVAVVLYLVMRK